MKVMAIDLGDARTGVAVSDALGMLTGSTSVIESWTKKKRPSLWRRPTENPGRAPRDGLSPQYGWLRGAESGSLPGICREARGTFG